MKISPCSSKSIEVKILSFDDIKKKEGIYRFRNKNSAHSFESSYGKQRLIVFKPAAEGAVVLYYNGDSNLSVADGDWAIFEYQITDETICFELKA